MLLMAKTVKLSDNLVIAAQKYSKIYSRSVPKQIEYWAQIGSLAEKNPNLSYSSISDLLAAKQETETTEG